MKHLYATRNCSWHSLGSPKGDFLLQYASQAYRLLGGGESILFQPSGPVVTSDDHQSLTLSFYSGGTSGKPEVVKHNEHTIASSVSGLVGRIGSSPIGSFCCLPLWHVGGWMQLERAWATGGQVVFGDYRDLLKTKNHDLLVGKWISLVPTQLHELLKSQTATDCLLRAKGIFIGGAAMNTHLIQKSRSLALPIFPCYGSSETAGMVTLLSSDSFLNLIDGVGEALAHASIRINETNQKIEIRSSSLCLSRGDEDFPANSWLKTPDLGYIGGSGSLVITGRSDRVINSGGEKIQPEIIENLLISSGLIEQCMAHGEAHEKWGECVVVSICPRGVKLDELKKIVKNELPLHMQPKIWRTMDALPLSDMGKRKN